MPLKVTIVTPKAILFDGLVDAVSSINDTGPFSILEAHTNFISIIHQHVTLYQAGQPIKRIKINQGVIATSQDDVKIFAGLANVTNSALKPSLAAAQPTVLEDS